MWRRRERWTRAGGNAESVPIRIATAASAWAARCRAARDVAPSNSPSKSDTQMKPFVFLFASIRDFDPPRSQSLTKIMRLALLLLLPATAAARGADANSPHPHQGLLAKYTRKAPAAYGLTLGGVNEEELRSGKPLMRLVKLPGGFKRAASIQDVPAPPEVVWRVIMDLENYPRMVEGVQECQIYRRKKSATGKQEVWARYKVTGGPFRMEYFMHHKYEPKKSAMTFHLDYDRLSDFADTVGYWYVEKLSDGWSRVYYSTDSTLPGWIPAFAKEQLVGLALKRSTGWVDEQCRKATGKRGAKKRRFHRRKLALLAFVVAATRFALAM